MKNRALSSLVASAAASLALLVGGCSDTPVMPEVEPEVQLSVVSGDGQAGVCFAELSEPLVVKATKPRNSKAPLPNELVNFRVAEGGGWVYGGSAETDGQGMAQDYWTLGYPGPQTLEVRAVDEEGTKHVFATFTATAEPRDWEETRVTPDASPDRNIDGYNFDFWADVVTWVERHYSSGSYSYGVGVYDMSSQTETELGPFENPRDLQISEDVIAWGEYVYGEYGYTIHIYDVRTKIEMQVGPPTYDWGFSGDLVVWSEYVSGAGYRLQLYDLRTQTTRQIVAPAYNTYYDYPVLSGDLIAWVKTEYSSGSYNRTLQLYNLRTQTERTIVGPSSTAMGNLAMSGDLIVWEHYYPDYTRDLHQYDLRTETQTQILGRAQSIGYWDLSGDEVVWMEYHSGMGYDFHLWDAQALTETQIAEPSWYRSGVAISDGRIAWPDRRGGYNADDVYLYEQPPCASPDD